jgi:hypothetical protein
MNWFKERLSEPSTYTALSLLIGAGGILGKMKEAPEIAQAVEASGTHFSTGDYMTGGLFLVTALAGIFMRERSSH